ncbi:MAG: hypothetical protein ACE5FL_12535 [Myxococcota bacterium]
MSLVAAELERQGISTVTIQLLREVAERVQPPRALFVPFRHGYPLDAPGDDTRQHAVLEAALRLLETGAPPPPLLVEFAPPGFRDA